MQKFFQQSRFSPVVAGLTLALRAVLISLEKKYLKRNFEIVWANDIDEAKAGTLGSILNMI